MSASSFSISFTASSAVAMISLLGSVLEVIEKLRREDRFRYGLIDCGFGGVFGASVPVGVLRRGKGGLTSTFAIFLTAIAKFGFWGVGWVVGYVSPLIWGFANIS